MSFEINLLVSRSPKCLVFEISSNIEETLVSVNIFLTSNTFPFNIIVFFKCSFKHKPIAKFLPYIND